MSTLIPCEHLSAALYTELVKGKSAKIIELLQLESIHKPGFVCTAVVEDTLDQVIVYHLKQVANQIGPKEAESYLADLLVKIQYHGQVAINRVTASL